MNQNKTFYCAFINAHHNSCERSPKLLPKIIMCTDYKVNIASDEKIKNHFMPLRYQYLFIKFKTFNYSILQTDDTDGPLSVH